MTDDMRPKHVALLLLAAGNRPPRQRARDQRADRAGFNLPQVVLHRLVELDPDADQLEATLLRVVQDMGPPAGPNRAIAASVRDELLETRENSGAVEHLISDALRAEHIQRARTP